jgi:hypothetical protein
MLVADLCPMCRGSFNMNTMTCDYCGTHCHEENNTLIPEQGIAESISVSDSFRRHHTVIQPARPKGHALSSHKMPSQLTGDLEKVWKTLREMAGENPESTIKVSPSMFDHVEILSSVGGCSFEQVDYDTLLVNLFFDPEESRSQHKDVSKGAAPGSYSMPRQLCGELADLWQELRKKSGSKPEAPISIYQKHKFELIESLAAVGGCYCRMVPSKGMFLRDEMQVELFFEPEEAPNNPMAVTNLHSSFVYA